MTTRTVASPDAQSPKGSADRRAPGTPDRRVHLIRHGETNWNRERRVQGQLESVLTERGVAQAKALATSLARLPIGAVFSSSSVRARQTADILFGHRSVPITYCDLIREIHIGPWQGQLYSAIEASHPEQFHNFWQSPDAFVLDGAETFALLQQRAVARLHSILDESRAAEIAIVSHGAWIKSLLCHIERRPLARLWDPPRQHNCAHSIVDVYSNNSLRISLYAGEPYPLVSNEADSECT